MERQDKTDFYIEQREIIPQKQKGFGGIVKNTIRTATRIAVKVFGGLTALGESIAKVSAIAAKALVLACAGACVALGSASKPFWIKMRLVLRLSAVRMLFPFIKIAATVRTICQRNRIVAAGLGRKAAAKDSVYIASHMLWRSRRNIGRAFCAVAPVVSLVFLLSLFKYISGLEYAVSIEYNGQELGFIETESDVEEAQIEVQKRISYVDGNETVNFTPKFSLKIIDEDSEFINTGELADKMIINSSEELSNAYGIYIDGEFCGAVSGDDVAAVEAELKAILAEYEAYDGVYDICFTKSTEVTGGLYLSDSVIDGEDIIELFNSKVTVETLYKIEDGDTPNLIAAKNGMTLADLRELNPNLDNICYRGVKVSVIKKENFLPVQYKKKAESTSDIEYTTVEFDDDTLTKGSSKVKVEGENGVLLTTEEVVYIDGAVESRNVVSSDIIKAPVEEQLAVGIKEPVVSYAAHYPQATYTGTIEDLGTGVFQRPLSTGYVSQRFSGYHRAIDMAAPEGTAIYAADGGTVVTSGWHYSYGNYIMIDHGNGFVTLYAHAIELYVEAGDVVTKGQNIAAVGNTGNSYGNHLHFEVRYQGTYTNPLDYVSAE